MPENKRPFVSRTMQYLHRYLKTKDPLFRGQNCYRIPSSTTVAVTSRIRRNLFVIFDQSATSLRRRRFVKICSSFSTNLQRRSDDAHSLKLVGHEWRIYDVVATLWWRRVPTGKVPFSVLLQDLKLGQCLDISDITSPSKFGKVTWPRSHFLGCFVFYRPAFGAISQIVL